MPRPPFPRSLSEFQTWFGTDEACLRYLMESRWPDGPASANCGAPCQYPGTRDPPGWAALDPQWCKEYAQPRHMDGDSLGFADGHA